MDVRGKIHFALPKVSTVFKSLDQCELDRCKIVPSSKLSPAKSLMPPIPATTSTLDKKESSRTGRADLQSDVPGHAAAAVVQKLRRAPDHPIDLERNLELLNMEEVEEPDADVISRQMSNYREENASADVTPAASVHLDVKNSTAEEYYPRRLTDASASAPGVDRSPGMASPRVSFRIPDSGRGDETGKGGSMTLRDRLQALLVADEAANSKITWAEPQAASGGEAPSMNGGGHHGGGGGGSAFKSDSMPKALTSGNSEPYQYEMLKPTATHPPSANVTVSEILPRTPKMDTTPIKRIPGYRLAIEMTVKSFPLTNHRALFT